MMAEQAAFDLFGWIKLKGWGCHNGFKHRERPGGQYGGQRSDLDCHLSDLYWSVLVGFAEPEAGSVHPLSQERAGQASASAAVHHFGTFRC